MLRWTREFLYRFPRLQIAIFFLLVFAAGWGMNGLTRDWRIRQPSLVRQEIIQGTASVVDITQTPEGTWTLQVSINGTRGRFLLDTGASISFVSDQFAKKAKVGLTQERRPINTTNGRIEAAIAVANSMMVGNLEKKDALLAVINFENFNSPGITHLDGILGLDFWGNFLIEIDFPKALLRLRSPKSDFWEAWW